MKLEITVEAMQDADHAGGGYMKVSFEVEPTVCKQIEADFVNFLVDKMDVLQKEFHESQGTICGPVEKLSGKRGTIPLGNG